MHNTVKPISGYCANIFHDMYQFTKVFVNDDYVDPGIGYYYITPLEYIESPYASKHSDTTEYSKDENEKNLIKRKYNNDYNMAYRKQFDTKKKTLTDAGIHIPYYWEEHFAGQYMPGHDI